ncbi:P2X purinoceptor 2 isoform X1 [Mobula birostris]|uniref:P2X purinoceptor 2 isoform X1 n=1 Tax=Mobula birostris TaxID=1983395 RepID=UPI003B288E03
MSIALQTQRQCAAGRRIREVRFARAHKPNTMGYNSVCNMWSEFWSYETQKVMVVKNRNIAVIYRIFQLAIVMYFIVYVFIIQKSYQDKENAPQSSVITKVKGIAITNSSFEGDVLDVADYVNPPEGQDTFSITVQTKTTPYQKMITCPEHYDVPGSNCTNDSECVSEEMNPFGNGVKTGRCVTFRDSIKTCEVRAWCPVENTASTRISSLKGIENLTLFIKNSIHFPRFGFSKGNILTNGGSRYLRKCMFDEVANLYCPIFSLKSVVEKSGVTFNSILKMGGVLGVIINWKCDLDKAASECKPQYSFRSLDIGYNFRKTRYFMENDTEYRTLTKVFGIRIDVIVYGEAGKFSIILLVINVASALTSVGIASFLCDWILLYLMKKSDVYKEKKFEEVVSEEVKQANDGPGTAEKELMTGTSQDYTDC